MPTLSRIATLMGSVSLLSLTTALAAQAQTAPPAQMAQAAPEQVPEQVLVTGSLIHGAAAVGVPVTNLSTQDFAETGAVTIADLFRSSVTSAVVAPESSAVNSGGQQTRLTRVNIRGLDSQGPRSLMLIDGVRYPPQTDGLCSIDPSIIPELALDRVDILTDGASATYGADAIAGVINILLKRGYDGATTLLHFDAPTDGGGGWKVQGSQLYGRTWDSGDITLTYEYTHEQPLTHPHSNFTMNYTPWGLDNRSPIGASLPGTVSTGAPVVNNGLGTSGAGTICSNCYSVPKGTGANFNASLNGGIGPTAPGSASTISWAQLQTDTGVTNEFDPNTTGWELARQDKNSAVATFDQRLFTRDGLQPGVSLFFSGFYVNRRALERAEDYYSTGAANGVHTFTVPTTNPYYPAGAPAGLQVSYALDDQEYPPWVSSFEISQRYQFGFNLDLPFNWTGQIYDSRSSEADEFIAFSVNDNAAEIALGQTVNGVSKPAGVPYLNLFCDPKAFQCNSPITIAYLGGERFNQSLWQMEEKGVHFDGPLFDLPGGPVKVAVGATDDSNNVVLQKYNNYSITPLSVPPGYLPYGHPPADLAAQPVGYDSEPYAVWAGFAQLDIPVFGDNFNLPLARKLDLEASWRHDQYSSPNGKLEGGTSNPKLAFTWLVDQTIGATVRGSWGTSFRFANAGEYSTVGSDTITPFGFSGISPLSINCNAQGQATGGSLDATLIASGFACGPAPGGLTWSGGPQAVLRSYVNAATGQQQTRAGGTALPPESGKNYSLGVEIAPTIDFLRGFDLQATFFSVKINNQIVRAAGGTAASLADPTARFLAIVPSDLGCPISANKNPTSCAPFEAMVTAALTDPASSQPLSQASNVYWIQDAGNIAGGMSHYDGVDFSASYDLDLGDLGAWNTGIVGTYYLHQWQSLAPGVPPIDLLHQNLGSIAGVAQNGVETGPRMRYRARLGWSNGPYSITGFMNYESHYFLTNEGTPPNVNLQCTSSGGTVGGGTFPCAINNFTSIEPNFITFDLSFGYNTGDAPSNDYLKHITLQLTVQNLFDRLSSFAYIPNFTGGQQANAYDPLRPNTGRVIGLTVIKNW
jgi:iron complex outermembrane recepter protein